jgi:hypothetical protein
MHSAFPKHQLGGTGPYYAICKSASSDLFIPSTGGAYIYNSLNVNVLSKDFRMFFQKFSDDIDNATDEGLLDNICDKYSKAFTKENTAFWESFYVPSTTMMPLNTNNPRK